MATGVRVVIVGAVMMRLGELLKNVVYLVRRRVEKE